MTCPLKPHTSSINPLNPQKTPDAPLNFRPCPAPISANSDGPLANFSAFPAATDTYPGSPEPQEPPPLFPIFATHHQLNTLVPLTYSGVSQQPQGDPRSPMIPSTYQHGPILDHNRHLPTPLSSAKPRCHSQCTLKFSGTVHSFAPTNLPYGLLPEPHQDLLFPCNPTSPDLPRQSESQATAVVTVNSIVIKEKDPKGKEKAAEKDDDDITIDPTNIPIPDNKALDMEFEDLLKSP
ncbi:hypothetical protein E4T56_gene7300 [Termitomyces sp. T112]|nr:hypothetical protein E4T56_gene7300 [Termitomyces sp. T112]